MKLKISFLILVCIFLISVVFAYDAINSLVLTNPDDETITGNTSIILNWTFLGYNVSEMVLTFNGTNSSISMTNCSNTTLLTGLRLKYFCSFNQTGLSPAYANTWHVKINDSDNVNVTSENRTIRIDNGNTGIGTVYNWTIADSDLTYNLSVTDTTPSICQAQVLEYNGSEYLNYYTSTGSYGTIGAYDLSSYCSGTIDSSQLSNNGKIIVQYRVGDMLGNINYSNKTGIFTSLYDGWNIAAWPDLNTSTESDTVVNICNKIDNCDIITWQNNSNGSSSFVTYDTTTPSINNDTRISSGEGILIHVSADSYILAHDRLPNNGESNQFTTIYNNTWNALGLIEDANLSTVYNAVANGTTNKNISMVSWNNAGTWITCQRSNGLCGGTSDAPSDVLVKQGQGVWVLVEDMGQTNITINRTGISS